LKVRKKKGEKKVFFCALGLLRLGYGIGYGVTGYALFLLITRITFGMIIGINCFRLGYDSAGGTCFFMSDYRHCWCCK